MKNIYYCAQVSLSIVFLPTRVGANAAEGWTRLKYHEHHYLLTLTTMPSTLFLLVYKRRTT